MNQQNGQLAMDYQMTRLTILQLLPKERPGLTVKEIAELLSATPIPQCDDVPGCFTMPFSQSLGACRKLLPEMLESNEITRYWDAEKTHFRYMTVSALVVSARPAPKVNPCQAMMVFCFEGQDIRWVEDGRPVANDVARVLGYADPAATVSKKVFRQNKGVADLATPGGIQSVTVLEEAGIYQLIFSSKLPYAEKFQQWVFSEVLPSLRANGNYSLGQAPQTPPAAPAAPQVDPSQLIQLAQALQSIAEASQNILGAMTALNSQLAPPAVSDPALFNSILTLFIRLGVPITPRLAKKYRLCKTTEEAVEAFKVFAKEGYGQMLVGRTVKFIPYDKDL